MQFHNPGCIFHIFHKEVSECQSWKETEKSVESEGNTNFTDTKSELCSIQNRMHALSLNYFKQMGQKQKPVFPGLLGRPSIF